MVYEKDFEKHNCEEKDFMFKHEKNLANINK